MLSGVPAASEKRLAPSQLGLAGLVVLIWGSNFIVMKWGLDAIQPLALCAWRFIFSFVPACLFFKPPKNRWPLMIAFGFLTGIGQFGLLCIAMKSMISPALASVVVQTQAFFSVLLASVILHERVRVGQIAGCLIAGSGLVVIAANAGTSATGTGIVLVLGAAMSWALCNVLVRASGYHGDLLSFVIWTSLFAAIPLAVASLIFEGQAALAFPLTKPSISTWLIIAWQAYANTLFGYGVWNSLIRRYSLSRIAPLTLLVPLVALILAIFLLGETLTHWKIGAVLLILGGLAVPQLAGKRTLNLPRWIEK